MRIVPAMQDMRRTPAEKEEAAEAFMPTAASQPDYPYGLSISLCQDELEKLDLADEDVQPGDLIHLHCMAVVTSVSKNNSEATGPQQRLELQITHIAAEDEAEEDAADEEEEDKPQRKNIPSLLYK
jgi:hypothetical protein